MGKNKKVQPKLIFLRAKLEEDYKQTCQTKNKITRVLYLWLDLAFSWDYSWDEPATPASVGSTDALTSKST